MGIADSIDDVNRRRNASTRLVLIAHRFQHHDGQGRVNFEVALGALKAGFDVTLLTAHCADQLPLAGAKVVNLGMEFLPTQLLRNAAFVQRTTRWLHAHRSEIDLIQANGFVTWLPCDIVTAHFVHAAWEKNSNYPFRSPFSLYALYQRAFSLLNARWERQAFRSANRVIAVSDAVADELRELGIRRDHIDVIYNGVDTEEYHPGSADRSSFGLPPSVPLSLFVGEIRTSRKNLGTLLRALQSLPEMHLAVAGETRESPFLSQAKDLGLTNRVHFLGKVTRVADLMRCADIFVFPSHYEAHPLVVLEAMATAMPIILSSQVGSTRSFGDCFAVLDDPNDATALAHLMIELWVDPERRRLLGEIAQQHAQNLTWGKTVEQYIAEYHSLAGRRTGNKMQLSQDGLAHAAR